MKQASCVDVCNLPLDKDSWSFFMECLMFTTRKLLGKLRPPCVFILIGLCKQAMKPLILVQQFRKLIMFLTALL